TILGSGGRNYKTPSPPLQEMLTTRNLTSAEVVRDSWQPFALAITGRSCQATSETGAWTSSARRWSTNETTGTNSPVGNGAAAGGLIGRARGSRPCSLGQLSRNRS